MFLFKEQFINRQQTGSTALLIVLATLVIAALPACVQSVMLSSQVKEKSLLQTFNEK
jgi:hypothetical protein